MTERSGERAPGTPNAIFDLSSVLFHALEGGASYDQYVQDAEKAGDEELADFFRRTRDEDAMRADEAQILLAERTPAAGAAGDVMPEGGIAAAGAAPGMEPIEDVPPLREEPIGVAPGTEPIEDVPLPREERTSVAPGTEPIVEEPSRQRTEPGTVAPGMEEEFPPRTEEPPLRTGEALPPRAPGMEESVSPRTEEDIPPPVEDRPLGTEGTMPPVTEEVPPRAEGIPPGTEEVPPRAEEAPLSGERARTRQAEEDQGEDRGLVEKVKDALSSEEERGRGEADEPRRR